MKQEGAIFPVLFPLHTVVLFFLRLVEEIWKEKKEKLKREKKRKKKERKAIFSQLFMPIEHG